MPDITDALAHGASSRRRLLATAGGGLAGLAAATSLGSVAHAGSAPRTGDGGGWSGGTQFFPVDPKRVYDSRLDTYDPTGPLEPDTERVIVVADGCDAAGTKIAKDMVPHGAQAIAVTITAAGPTGPNFLSIAPSDADSFASSTINFPGGFDIATSTIVKLGEDRAVKVFSGDQAGSTDVVIDVTGYFA